MRSSLRAISLCLLVFAPSIARANCFNLPSAVNSYVSRQIGWTLLTLADLDDQERTLWQRYNGLSCPGYARVKFDGSGHTSYAVALIRKIGGALHERLYLLHYTNNTMSAESLSPDWDVSGPMVVYQIKPGSYTDVVTGEKVAIPYEGVVFEKMESEDHLFYMSKNGIRNFMLTD